MAKRSFSSAAYWPMGLFFAVGYGAVFAARRLGLEMPAPILGSVAAVALTIPFCSRKRGVAIAALWGAMLGFAAAFGIAAAMLTYRRLTVGSTTQPMDATTQPINPEIMQLDFAITAAITMICCTLAAALFCALGHRRRRRAGTEA